MGYISIKNPELYWFVLVDIVLYLMAPFVWIPLFNTLLGIKIVKIMKNSRRIRADNKTGEETNPKDVKVAISLIAISIYHLCCFSTMIWFFTSPLGIYSF
jgi:hypothetical protein